MINIIVAAIILAMLSAAIAYIVREKKKGVKCIGCPAAGSCAHCKQGSCKSSDVEKRRKK